MELDEYISLASTADRLDLSPNTVRRWITEGKLPAYRVGGRATIRFRVADVVALLEPIPATERGD